MFKGIELVPEAFCSNCDQDTQSTDELVLSNPIQECQWCSEMVDYSFNEED